MVIEYTDAWFVHHIWNMRSVRSAIANNLWQEYVDE